MAPIKITVGERKLAIVDQSHLDDWLSNKLKVDSLVGADGAELDRFELFVGGGTYTLGPPIQQQNEPSAPRPNAEDTGPSPAKKIKNIKTELAKNNFFSVAKPRNEVFGREKAKDVVMTYVKQCASKDSEVLAGGKFTMLGTSGVKGIGKTELQQQICGKWLKEDPDIKAEAVYASYNGNGHAAPYCKDVKAIEKNLYENDRVGYYVDSLGHLLLVSCGVDLRTAIQVPIDEAIEYIRDKKFGEESDGTLVICADEILELNNPVPGYFDLENKQMILAEVIMSQCMGLQDKEDGKLIFIFTSILDSMYTKMVSGSGRPVRPLPLSLIPLQDVFGSMLSDDLKLLMRSQPAVHQLVLSCAGHPRAIVDGVRSATTSWGTEQWKTKEEMTNKIIIARSKIMENCKFVVEYINDQILADWFDTPPVPTKRRQELLWNGILHEAAKGVEYLFPLLLQEWAIKNKEHSAFAYHLDGLFDADADALLGPHTEKYMEPVMYHFEALRRKAMAGKPFDLKSFYQTKGVGEKFATREVTAPVPAGTACLVQYVKSFEDMKTVLSYLKTGYLVVSLKATEKGIEYLTPYNDSDEKLLVACVQCKFVQKSVKWPDIKSEMEKAVKGLTGANIQHFPVIYTTSDQQKVLAKTCADGVYLVERDVFAFTKRVGILRLHTQQLGNVLAKEYPFLEGSQL